MIYDYAMEKADYSRIEKLNAIKETQGFWDKVKDLCSNVKSDKALSSWQRLAERRYLELRAYDKAWEIGITEPSTMEEMEGSDTEELEEFLREGR